ncbi:MAG: class I SAM-dependent methyltransferase [Polyangiaceae bacterium]
MLDRQDERYRNAWEAVYAAGSNPFDVKEPLDWVTELAAQGAFGQRVLEVGCGGGHNAAYLAARGHSVVGVDVAPSAIARARARAAARKLVAEFVVADVRDLSALAPGFDSVLDIGCFHSLDSDADRDAYAAALASVCRRGARLHLRAASDRNAPRTVGAHAAPRVSEADLRRTFAAPTWQLEQLASRTTTVMIRNPPEPHEFDFWYANFVVNAGD